MALGSLGENTDSGLKIVPCGMNYFAPHKFRSRAVVEFGPPMEVPKDLVDLYRSGERREATRQLLEMIYHGLLAVTVTTTDYDSLMLIQAVRRLYKPKGKKLPLPMIVELNRRLSLGYEHFKDDSRIISLKKEVTDYNAQLWRLGIRDHQVEYATLTVPVVIVTLIYRVAKLAVLSIGTLPGLVLFAPVFIASKVISIRKSKEALAASTVKLQGRDVVATWKLLVAMVVAPTLYTFYMSIVVYWTYRNRIQGYVPEWVPLWIMAVLIYAISIMITFAALRIGETGMDILKSLRPLVLSLNPTSANTFVQLRKKRAELSIAVTDLINELGPEIFPDFERARLVADPFKQGILQEPSEALESPSHSRNVSLEHGSSEEPPPGIARQGSIAHGTLPRNESFHDLGNMGIFASRPVSRSRSRNGSRVEGLSGFSALTSMSTRESLDEVSKRIRGAMHERGKERSRRRSEGSWDFAEGDGEAEEDTSVEEGKKDI